MSDVEPVGRRAQGAPPWISAAEVFARTDYASAVRAIQRDLRAGLEPGDDFSRAILPVAHGQLLVMPSQSDRFVGVKIATVAPGNPSLGKERIQGIYVLLDAATLSPLALLDGTALTTLRTPAVSAAVADYLAPDRVDHLVVFGAGPQARGHIHSIRAIRTVERITVVGSARGRAAAFARELRADGMNAREGVAADVRDAQIIVCATTARTPLFDGGAIANDSCTIAVGSHETDAREFDSVLAGRSQIVVENVAVALRESGEVAIPISEGIVRPHELVPLRDIVIGSVPVDRTRPRVFTSSGMSWEDLVIAAEVYESPHAAAR